MLTLLHAFNFKALLKKGYAGAGSDVDNCGSEFKRPYASRHGGVLDNKKICLYSK